MQESMTERSNSTVLQLILLIFVADRHESSLTWNVKRCGLLAPPDAGVKTSNGFESEFISVAT